MYSKTEPEANFAERIVLHYNKEKQEGKDGGGGMANMTKYIFGFIIAS